MINSLNFKTTYSKLYLLEFKFQQPENMHYMYITKNPVNYCYAIEIRINNLKVSYDTITKPVYTYFSEISTRFIGSNEL